MDTILQKKYGLTTNRPIIALAPMAGVTDLPFRSLCEYLGADYSVTEMAASAPQLLDSEKNKTRLQFTPNARIKVLQIIGNNALYMAQAAKQYAALGADIIDINLGCPAKKVSKKGAGSALLSDLSLVADILAMIVDNCPVPVTVKTRLGTDHENYTLYPLAKILDDLGIKLLTVHGRTRACKFNGIAQFDEIARIKQAFPHLMVVANGDINSRETAQAVLEHTKCDGLMIGRGAVGCPWLFSEIRSRLDDDYSLESFNKISLIMKHIGQIHDFYGEIKGVRFARKHIQAYLQHLNVVQYFSVLAKITSPEKQLEELQNILTNKLV